MNVKSLTIGAVILGFLLIAGSIGYHFMINLPQQEEVRIAKVEIRLENRDACLLRAKERHKYEWNRTCTYNQLPDYCGLSDWLAINLDKMIERDETRCFKLYPLLE